ncbi:unnamed protein product [Ectocarpus sp. 6 AP-2014]
MKTAVFKEFKTAQRFTLNDSRHGGGRAERILAKGLGGLNSSRHGRGGASLNTSRHGGGGTGGGGGGGGGGVDTRPAIVRAATSLNESRHKLTQGLRRTVSRGQLSDADQGQMHSPVPICHSMVVEEGSNILILKGTLRRRVGTATLSSLKEEKAVTIIRGVGGPVEFTEGSVVFIMPAVLMARASAAHQMLMREIEQRHRDLTAAAADGIRPAKLESGVVSMDAGASPGPRLAKDAMTMAAADEANPLAHPDALRRRRTLRDAGLAAKAKAAAADATADAAGKPGESSSGGDGDGGADHHGGSGEGGREEAEAPWIGRRVLSVGGETHVVAPDHSTARLSISGSSRVGRQGSFVEMQNVPVTAAEGGDDLDDCRDERHDHALIDMMDDRYSGNA